MSTLDYYLLLPTTTYFHLLLPTSICCYLLLPTTTVTYYYDVGEGFGSVRDSYEKARKDDAGITLDYVICKAINGISAEEAKEYLHESQFLYTPFSQIQISNRDETTWRAYRELF